MRSVWVSRGERLHTRSISVTTYGYDDRRIVVEGVLQDERFLETRVITGETFPEGVIHRMVVRLLVNCSDFLIEDVDAEMPSVPRAVCREARNCLAPLKGLTVTRGFMSKVKQIAGGTNGCTHFVELIQAMAPAVFQGSGAHRSTRHSGMDPEHARRMFERLLNTCHAWREGTPFVETCRKKLYGQ